MKNLWIAGESGNKQGRPKNTTYSILTTKGRIQRFLCKNMSAKAMQSLYNKLTAKDQLSMLTELLPYVAAKQTSVDTLSNSDIDKLHSEIMKALNNKNVESKAG